MTAARRATSKKKASQIAHESARRILLALLLLCLGLSCVTLALMITNVGTLDGLRGAFAELQVNYATRREAPPIAKEPVAPAPPVLFSVVRFREGEEARIRMDLIEPLLAHYARTPFPSALAAMLIERRNPGSRDVRVRLFFGDGTETSYLWPSTHAEDGKWVP